MFSNTVTPLTLATSLLLASPAAAFFRMSCPGRLTQERLDPIVNPGAVAGHVHSISGGSGFAANMTYEQARASTCSSCQIKEDFSNYWTPQLYHLAKNGTYTNVPVAGENGGNGGMTVYYLQRGDDNNRKAFPAGFRMLAGDSDRRNNSNPLGLTSPAVSYACLYTGDTETEYIPKKDCPGGLRAQVFFPSCWDGKNLDSPDHKSHMAYPSLMNNGKCPSTHPVQMVSIFYELLYSISGFDRWNDQPFVFSNGDATGYGFHGDFVNGWDVDVLQKAVDTCTNLSGAVSDCPAVTMYTDTEAKACQIPKSINETVVGELAALPGCNTPSTGPAPAVKTVCAANAGLTVGSYQATNYVDVTKSKGYKYIGCATDNYYTRTLTGQNKGTDTMTVESCMDYCSAGGFTYAGLEYGRECWCGNNDLGDNAPKAGVMGSCSMPCSGDTNEICGASGGLSLYQKCGSSDCTNAQYGAAATTTSSKRSIKLPGRREAKI